MAISISKRLEYFRYSVIVLFILGIILSLPLWTHDRTFPTLPLFSEHSFLPIPFDYVALAAVFILLAILLISWDRKIVFGLFGLLFLLVADDQNRLQAWLYVYFLFLLAFSLAQDEQSTLRFLRIVVIGVYAWSGIHKLNQGFIHGTFEGILSQLTSWDDTQIGRWSDLGFIIPGTEMVIAFMLVLPDARKFACILAVLTHVIIVVYLAGWAENSNFVVYPWNMAMIAGALLLFWNTNDVIIELRALKEWRHSLFILIVWFLPVLNFFGMWDHYLSFSYYSGKASAYYIAISEEAQSSIEKKVHRYFIKPDGVSGGTFIDVNAWSLGELHVPFVPQQRTFDEVRKAFCSRGIPADQIYFFEVIPGKEKAFIRKSCGDE